MCAKIVGEIDHRTTQPSTKEISESTPIPINTLKTSTSLQAMMCMRGQHTIDMRRDKLELES